MATATALSCRHYNMLMSISVVVMVVKKREGGACKAAGT